MINVSDELSIKRIESIVEKIREIRESTPEMEGKDLEVKEKEKKERRVKVLCEDVDCEFKSKNGRFTTLDGCRINKAMAIEFFEKHGITTCEFGCKEKSVFKTNKENSTYVSKLLRGGRV